MLPIDESLGFMALGEDDIFPSDFLSEMQAGLGCEVEYRDEEQTQMVFIGWMQIESQKSETTIHI